VAAASIAPAPQSAPVPAPAIAVVDVALEARLSSTPTHGFTSADLPVLLSTFLI
jgi:hypothetical protein